MSSRERRQLDLRDGPVSYRWVRSRRRKHAHLVLDDRHGLELRTPVWMSAGQADRLIEEHARWVHQALARFEAGRAARPTLCEGACLPLLDERVELRLRFAHRAQVSLRGDQLVVAGERLEEPALRKSLESWYRREAGVRLGQRLSAWGESTGLRHAGLTIRAQRARWGSCSSRGNINLNWRLLLLPEALVDYVLVHELCHLRHMNHSAAFWALLEGYMPDYRERMARVGNVRGADLAL